MAKFTFQTRPTLKHSQRAARAANPDLKDAEDLKFDADTLLITSAKAPLTKKNALKRIIFVLLAFVSTRVLSKKQNSTAKNALAGRLLI